MAAIPKKVAERLVAGLKRYQPILAAAKARDVGEADTVTIIKDMLADVFGYDKYSDVTSHLVADVVAISWAKKSLVVKMRWSRLKSQCQ